ncbi:MAG: benzoyl-CoA reductase, bzd-type, subunit Q [Rickettsiales bacterium]|jgi:bzd-type benzoyl-CoA reductase Q subunit|nr:benzoyl-CoA reductase, bzd-type, subunit Q [Rickettsiales bacterium]
MYKDIKATLKREVEHTMNEVEYWRWKESNWKNPEISNWRGKLITAGVDIGSTSTQSVILVDGELYAYSSMRTGANSPNSAIDAIKWAMEGTDMTIEDLNYTIGTGYGRVNVPFANKNITEITCHARGANFIYGPTVRTVLDMGGQDCKAIHCDAKGRVTSFVMNDKCAAGTGRGMEVIADLLAVHVEDIGEMSFDIDEEPAPVSSTCVIFAKTEATNLMRKGWTKQKVLAAYCHAMALRVVRLLERNGMETDFAITGGIVKNIGVTRRIERILGVKAIAPKYDTQLAGAIGAAFIAKELVEKRNGRSA